VLTNRHLAVIDTAAGVVSSTIETETRPRGVAASRDGRRLYVAMPESVTVLDRATSEPIATIPVDERPEAICLTPDGRALYVVGGPDEAGLTVIDTTRDAVVTKLPVGSATSIVAAPDSRTVWVHHGESDTLSVIDTGTNTVTATVSAPAPDGAHLAVAPDSSRIYAAGGRGMHTINVFDVAGRTKLGEIRDLSGRITDLAVAPDGRHLFVGITGTGVRDSVRVFDTATSFAVQDIPLSGPPSGIGFTPDGRTLYVASWETGRTFVLDTTPYA
jgi:YVTN family beta-propeller protein